MHFNTSVAVACMLFFASAAPTKRVLWSPETVDVVEAESPIKKAFAAKVHAPATLTDKIELDEHLIEGAETSQVLDEDPIAKKKKPNSPEAKAKSVKWSDDVVDHNHDTRKGRFVQYKKKSYNLNHSFDDDELASPAVDNEAMISGYEAFLLANKQSDEDKEVSKTEQNESYKIPESPFGKVVLLHEEKQGKNAQGTKSEIDK
jgi:hypothetical protein